MTEEAAPRTVRIEARLFLLAPEGFLAIGMGQLKRFPADLNRDSQG